MRKLNDACVHDLFLMSFIDEVLENFGGKEAYSFTNVFLGYHQIKITSEDRRKTTSHQTSKRFNSNQARAGKNTTPSAGY